MWKTVVDLEKGTQEVMDLTPAEVAATEMINPDRLAEKERLAKGPVPTIEERLATLEAKK